MKTKNTTPPTKKAKVLTVIFFILLLAGCYKMCSSSNDDKVVAPQTASKASMDSVVNVIKKDSLYKIKDVYFNEKTGSFNIAFVYSKGDLFNTYYFNKTYHLDDIENVEGVYLYAYQKGSSLANGDYKKPLAYDSKKLAERIEKFNKSGYKYEIESFLKKSVNDPTGLEIMETWVLNENTDGTYAVKATFRAKNPFGALMMHTVSCDMDMEGNSTHIVYDK